MFFFRSGAWISDEIVVVRDFRKSVNDDGVLRIRCFASLIKRNKWAVGSYFFGFLTSVRTRRGNDGNKKLPKNAGDETATLVQLTNHLIEWHNNDFVIGLSRQIYTWVAVFFSTIEIERWEFKGKKNVTKVDKISLVWDPAVTEMVGIGSRYVTILNKSLPYLTGCSLNNLWLICIHLTYFMICGKYLRLHLNWSIYFDFGFEKLFNDKYKPPQIN